MPENDVIQNQKNIDLKHTKIQFFLPLSDLNKKFKIMIKRISSLIVLYTYVIFSVGAQEVLNKDMIFTRQSQIDSFPVLYPDCHRIDGWVHISGEGISNLMGLMKLDTLGSLYVINCPSLVKLKGINSLKSIENKLILRDLPNLQSLFVLNKLTKLNQLSLSSLPRLKSLEGLNHLDSIVLLELREDYCMNGFCNLDDLNNLKSIDYLNFTNIKQDFSLSGLSNIEYFSGITITSCEANVALTDLQNLDSISNLYFTNNSGIESFTIPENINKLNNLMVARNNGLQSIYGFDKLEKANAILFLNNEDLTDISSFSSLKKLGSLSFIGNNAIDSLIAFPLLNELNTIEITNNKLLQYINGAHDVSKLNELILTDNLSLKKVTMLEHLDTIITGRTYSGIYINRNPELIDIEFLSSLKYTETYFEIKECNRLIDLSPLNQLRHMGYDMDIRSNQSLEILPAWNNINLDNTHRLTIKDNPNLAYCHYDWLCTYLSQSNPATIEGNKAACETIAKVKESCGITSTNELSISDISISISGKNIHVVSGKGQELKEIRLIALSGKEILHKNCIGNFESISYGSYPAGLYVICVETNNKLVHKKLVLH